MSKADLHLLYVFCRVAEARGFSSAQIILNVSASTISRQIADLETRLGMRLCQRGRKGFRLTDKGKAVYAASHKLFSALDQFSETVDGMRGKTGWPIDGGSHRQLGFQQRRSDHGGHCPSLPGSLQA